MRRPPPATIVIKEFSKNGLDKWLRKCWAVAKLTSCICRSYEQWTFLPYTVTEIRNIYSQKWNCAASFPISTLMCLGAIYIFPQLVLFGISIFLYCLSEFSAQLQERREGQGTAAKQWLAAVPCPPLRSCGWAESSDKWPTYKISNLENYGSIMEM